MNQVILELILKNAIGCIMLLIILFIDKNLSLDKKNVISVLIACILKVILGIGSFYHTSFNWFIATLSFALSIGIIFICSSNKAKGYISYVKYKIISGLFNFVFSFLGSYSITFPFAANKWFYYFSYIVILFVYYIISRIMNKEANRKSILINTILIIIAFVESYVFEVYYIGYLESFIIKISLLIFMIIVNRKQRNKTINCA